uniref:MutS-like protein n=1 Tax=Toxoplasma gondii TaxID=5811 RepID=B6DST1_TOXGO|nr:MutS-like protein [Toxoplasma gondii]
MGGDSVCSDRDQEWRFSSRQEFFCSIASRALRPASGPGAPLRGSASFARYRWKLQTILFSLVCISVEVNARLLMEMFPRQRGCRQGLACSVPQAYWSINALLSANKMHGRTSKSFLQKVAKRDSSCGGWATLGQHQLLDFFSAAARDAAGQLRGCRASLPFLASSRRVAFVVHPDRRLARPTIQLPHAISDRQTHFPSNASRLSGRFFHTQKRPEAPTRDNLLGPKPSRRAEENCSVLRSSAESCPPPSVAVHPTFLARLPLLSRPASRRLLSFLSFDHPSMVPDSLHMPPLLVFVREQKRLRPDKVLIIQVGDFFEAYGLDAVLLVEYCGLNPMGGKAKAGCPKQNLQQTLDCLTSEGFSVSVFEEFASPVAATPIAPGNRKLRLLTQIVSPSSPLYLPAHMPLYEGEIGAHTPDSEPIFSLYYSPSAGYACGEIDVPQRTLRVEGGLTADGVEMRITSATGGAPRGELYVHQMSALGVRDDGTTRLAKRLFPSLQKIYLRDYSSPSAFHRAVLRHLTASLQVPHSEFTIRSHLDYFSPSVAVPEPAASPADPCLLSPSELGASQAAPPRNGSLSFPENRAPFPPEPQLSTAALSAEDARRQAETLERGLAEDGRARTDAALRSASEESPAEPPRQNSGEVVSPHSQQVPPLLARPQKHRPHPLYVSTASQLGLLRPSGRQGNTVASTSSFVVPPLHLAALPPGAPVTSTRFIQRLLLFPPPHAVADAVQNILRQLLRLGCTDSRLSSTFMKHFPGSSSPSAERSQAPTGKEEGDGVCVGCQSPPRATDFSAKNRSSERGLAQSGQAAALDSSAENLATHAENSDVLLVPSVRVMDAGKLVQVISSRSANRRFFLEVLTLLAPTRYCLRRYPPSLLKPLLTVLQHETQQQVCQERFLQGVEKAIALIEQVLLLEEEEQEAAAEGAALAAIAAAEQMSRLAASEVQGRPFENLSPHSQSAQSGENSTFGGDSRDIYSAADAAAAAARAVAEAAAAREAAEEAAARAMATVAGGHATSSSTRGLLPILDDYFKRMERFRGHIQPFCVPYAHALVAAAVDDLLVSIFEDFAGAARMPALPAVCTLEEFLPSRSRAPGGEKTPLTARDVVDLFIALERRQTPGKGSAAPSARLAWLLEKQTPVRLKIPPAALFSSIAALQRQRLAAAKSGDFGRPAGEWLRLIAALQKKLWGDTLNESVYLKKGKPPLEPVKAISRNGREKNAKSSAALTPEFECGVAEAQAANAVTHGVERSSCREAFEALGETPGEALVSREEGMGSGLRVTERATDLHAGEFGTNEREANEQRSAVATTPHWSKTPEHPRDRHGHQIASAWTTPRVAACSRAYTAAKNFAASAVEKRLRELSRDLQPLLPDILLAAHLIIILQSLSHHSTFAATNGWHLPQLLDPNAEAELKVDTLTPYYMRRPDLNTLRRQRAVQRDRAALLDREDRGSDTNRIAESRRTGTKNEELPTDDEFANANRTQSRDPLSEQVQKDTASLLAHASSSLSKEREVVSYSFDMHGLFVLTGENMAGKSTFCRSVLALVVLANAGLFCPCGPATTVPRYGAFLASSYMAHDSPLENKSFFYEELSQLHNILSQARSYGKVLPEKTAALPASLLSSDTSDAGVSLRTETADVALTTPFVIVDEPCKGTAPKWGAGFVGAALELLCRGNTHGVLSTHLHHELSRLPLDLQPNVRFKRMGVRKRNPTSLVLPESCSGPASLTGGRDLPRFKSSQPLSSPLDSDKRTHFAAGSLGDDRLYTFELLDGICQDSNAMQTAWKVGMPSGIITRANALQAHLDAVDQGKIPCKIGGVSRGAVIKDGDGANTGISSETSDEIVSSGTIAEKRFPEMHETPKQPPDELPRHRNENGQEPQGTTADVSETVQLHTFHQPNPENAGSPNGEPTPCGGIGLFAEPQGIVDFPNRSASVMSAFASSAMASNALLARLRLAMIETTRELTCANAPAECVRNQAESRNNALHSVDTNAERPPLKIASAKDVLPVLELPALSRRLAAPPPWQDCSACVYMLVAPCTAARNAHRRAYLASEVPMRRPPDFPAQEATRSRASADEPAGFCANVYVGETERLETRLRTHSRSPLWAHARVLVVRVKNKAEAREVETALIRRLKEEKGVVLMSLKDGNRRASGLSVREDVSTSESQDGRD